MSHPEKTKPERIDVDRALQHAGRHESRRLLSWLLATAIVAVVSAVVTRDLVVAFVVVAFGVALVIWSLRLKWGAWLALRDFRKAATPPTRAHVVLLHDPAPRTFRPLLAIWPTEPAAGKRLPKPDRVYRCDDELTDLESYQGQVVVHEAWVDTGRRPTSKPRWIAADAGIAVPHRRVILGRWYFSMLVRGDRPDSATPLTIDAPAPAAVPVIDDSPLEGSLRGEVGWRCVLLTGLAALSWWL